MKLGPVHTSESLTLPSLLLIFYLCLLFIKRYIISVEGYTWQKEGLRRGIRRDFILRNTDGPLSLCVITIIQG